ncbi:MAG: hypothetical protein ACI4OY_06355 [Aristaeellaceae bacterium]
MNRCWKCSQELPEGASLCHACGADQQERCPLSPQCSEEARAMRAIYDHYGCRQVLGNATLLHNALGDYLGEDGRKLRNQVRIAMDSGLGKLYLAQLEHPAPQFSAQALNLLTDAGLSEQTARQLKALFDAMVGFPADAPAGPVPPPPPPKTEVSRSQGQENTSPVQPPQPETSRKPEPVHMPPQPHQQQRSKMPWWLFCLILVAVSVIGSYTVNYLQADGRLLGAKPTATPTVRVTATPTPRPTATPTPKPTATPTPKPTATPTPKPTATPTPKPTATAVAPSTPKTSSGSTSSRTFEINSGITSDSGRYTITWEDSANAAPYQLTYQYVDESSSAVQCNFWAGFNESDSTTNSKSFTYLHLIPGKTYKFTVKDSNGVRTSRTLTLPTPSSFVDGKLKASSIKASCKYRYMESGADYKDAKELSKFSAAEMMANMSNSGYRYGLYYRIDLPQLATSREFYTTIAFYAPNGFTYTEVPGDISYSSFNNASGSYRYWYCAGTGFFDLLYEKNGTIPTGTYTVELYWDGMIVNTTTFTVN